MSEHVCTSYCMINYCLAFAKTHTAYIEDCFERAEKASRKLDNAIKEKRTMGFDGIPDYVLDLTVPVLYGAEMQLRDFLIEELNEDIVTSKWVVESEGDGVYLASLNLTTPTRDAVLFTTPTGCFLMKQER